MDKIRDLKVKLIEVFPTDLEIGDTTVFNGETVKIIAYSPWHDGATIEYEDGRQTWVDCFRNTTRSDNCEILTHDLWRKANDVYGDMINNKITNKQLDACLKNINLTKQIIYLIETSLKDAQDRSDPCRCNR